MIDTEITIHLIQGYMIKEEKYPDGTIRYYIKGMVDQEMWEELMYWWTEAKRPTNELCKSLDEVKEIILPSK